VASVGVFKPGSEGLARSVGAVPLEARVCAVRRPPHVLPLFYARVCGRPGEPVPSGSAAPGGWCRPPPPPLPFAPCASAERFLRVPCPVWGGVPPTRAPSLPAPGRGFAALPSGCVPAAPGGRRPGGSAASEDLPPPGTPTRAAAPFPAGVPGAPAPLPLQAAAAMDEKYLPELMAEKDSLDPSFTHALRLVNQGEGPAGRGAGPESVRGLLFVLHRSAGRCGGFFVVFRLLVFTGSCPLPLGGLRGGVGGVCPAQGPLPGQRSAAAVGEAGGSGRSGSASQQQPRDRLPGALLSQVAAGVIENAPS